MRKSGRIWRSQDVGLTWTPLPPYAPQQIVLSQNYPTDQTLYALGKDPEANQEALWRSTDGGDTWTTQIINLPPSQSHLSIAVWDANTIYARRSGGPGLGTPQDGLFRSIDAGSSWTQLYVGRVYGLGISPLFNEDQTLLINPGDYKMSFGLHKSVDGGQTWRLNDTGLGAHNPGTHITWIEFAPGYAENRTIFLNYGGALFRSRDSGDTWEDLTRPTGLGFYIEEQVISPRYAVDQTVWMFENYGMCWPGEPCRPAGTYRSRDGGVNWELLPAPEMLRVQSAGEFCNTDGACGVQLFARHYSQSDSNMRLYTSFDDGDTWQCLSEPVAPMPASPPPAEIPEPATWLLLAGGMAALARAAQRARQGKRSQVV